MTVLNKRTDTIPADAVYVGRGSPWGNPFLLPGLVGGSAIRTLGATRLTVVAKDRDDSIARYRRLLADALEARQLALEDLAALNGRDLVCYCAPQACHADVLARAAAWAAEQVDRWGATVEKTP